MKKLDMKKQRNRQYAAGRVLQLAAVCCRACHYFFKRGWVRRFNRNLGLINNLYLSDCGKNKKLNWKRAGQHIAEYAVLITAISVALTIMYLYMKRGLQAVIKDQVDNAIGPQIESAPTAGMREMHNSVSVVDTIGDDASRIAMSSSGAVRYASNSTSSSTGDAVLVSGQVFMPKDTD